MNRLIIAVCIVLFSSGCATKDVSTTKDVSSSSAVKQFSVEIISEPSGAKVEVNDNYVGVTPLTIDLEGWESTRTFTRRCTIVAHPVRAGGQTQVKVFSGWSHPDHTYGDKIPNRIYFNMNLIRIPEQLDLHIKK